MSVPTLKYQAVSVCHHKSLWNSDSNIHKTHIQPHNYVLYFTLLFLPCSDVETKKYNDQKQHIYFATNSYKFQLYKQAIIKLYEKTKI